MNKEKGEEKRAELIKKYNLDIESLKNEQVKLAKELTIKDKIDFKLADSFGAIDNTFVNNKILSCLVICNKEFEVIDKVYVYEKVKFPYIPGFRNYRELASMMNAYDKLSERPDVMFVPAQGITHQRLGLASHFGLSTGIPTIGVASSIVDCEIKDEDIIKDGKKVGKVFLSKMGSKPIYISPGNNITIESSINISKKLINPPHKFPEPMHLASKYSREVVKELTEE